jgi:hypothetical protein
MVALELLLLRRLADTHHQHRGPLSTRHLSQPNWTNTRSRNIGSIDGIRLASCFLLCVWLETAAVMGSTQRLANRRLSFLCTNFEDSRHSGVYAKENYRLHGVVGAYIVAEITLVHAI